MNLAVPGPTPVKKKAAKKATSQTPQDPPSGTARRWIDGMLSNWSGFVPAIGAVGAAVAGYDLARTIGTGEHDPSLFVVMLFWLAVFAVGVVIVITTPTRVRNAARLSPSSPAVDQSKAIPRELALGHSTLREFNEALADLMQSSRSFAARGLATPPGTEVLIQQYIAQRAAINDHLAAEHLRRTTSMQVFGACLGAAMAIVGYGAATFLANESVREAEMVDEAAQRSADQQDQILAASLSAPLPGAVLPATPSEIGVLLPLEADGLMGDDLAASVFGEQVDESCWNAGRTGVAVDVVESDVGRERRIVRVVLAELSEVCPSITIDVEPSWVASTDVIKASVEQRAAAIAATSEDEVDE